MNFLRSLTAGRLYVRCTAVLFLVLVASCTAPKITPVSTAPSTPEATLIPHAAEIRFALIGGVTVANVWSLFDAQGYSYNNYAVRSDYWPRLYRLSIPGRQFEPSAAGALPFPIQPEGNFYTGVVPLQSDLTWTDGLPFTADDVAFTVNTILSFQLGFDWHDHYNPDWLDHVDVIDAQTVKFYFKKMPNVGIWQYGALQGPVLQKAFWAPRIADPVALLPSADLRSKLGALNIKVFDLQKRVDALNAAIRTMTGDEARQTQASLLHQQGDLDKAINDLSKAQAESDTAMRTARAMLYSLDDQGEPHLGVWNYLASGNGFVENKVNPEYSPGQAGIDRAVYHIYPTEAAALTAYSHDDVDAILIPGGLSSQSLAGYPAPQALMKSSSRGLWFLVFNPLFATLNDPAIHQALACMIAQEQLASQLNEQVYPLESFVVPAEEPWINTEASLPCKGLDEPARIEQAVQFLKSAGYTWGQEPVANAAGQKLTLPNGKSFPRLTLLVPSNDDERLEAAAYVEHQARMLGIPLTVQPLSSVDVNYAVLGTQTYEMALLGWHVSGYPGYLCDWFGEENQFQYDGSQIKSLCDRLTATSDLDTAHQQILEVQSILARELPFIPLYSGVTYDAYRNVTYPFDQVPDGLSSVYGAPALAIPAKP